jgi:hypothetical protein
VHLTFYGWIFAPMHIAIHIGMTSLCGAEGRRVGDIWGLNRVTKGLDQMVEIKRIL